MIVCAIGQCAVNLSIESEIKLMRCQWLVQGHATPTVKPLKAYCDLERPHIDMSIMVGCGVRLVHWLYYCLMLLVWAWLTCPWTHC